MGMTTASIRASSVRDVAGIQKAHPKERLIALAGNPNVGKSTVFNALTGLRQHTGNWPGKTVTNAQGVHRQGDTDYRFVDLPGTYSLLSSSVEEEIARDFLCFGGADATVVVADATCLERNLNLVLQTLEITPKVVLCVNLMDEAKRVGISVNLEALSQKLGIPVVGASARKGDGLEELMAKVESLTGEQATFHPVSVRYTPVIEAAVHSLQPLLQDHLEGKLPARWAALRLIEGEETLTRRILEVTDLDEAGSAALLAQVAAARQTILDSGVEQAKLGDVMVRCIVLMAETIASQVCTVPCRCRERDRKLDHLLTGRLLGLPLMILLLFGVLWLSIAGANLPSQGLAFLFNRLETYLHHLFTYLRSPPWLHGLLVEGMFRSLGWVVSVMLPPMAIFFPLFTLLEDVGYLPRIAFNLDNSFKKSGACGKQALTLCMGFGCNAAGVTGCRIIDSPRERLIAILTNSLVPCNGRFPMLIALIGILLAGHVSQGIGSVLSALLLAGFLVLGVVATLVASRLLSQTLLRGIPSSFTLEMPPYRKPQVGQIIIRSLLDRTLFVLGRAVAVAAPAGMFLWVMANVTVGDSSLLALCAGFLDPFARLLGMDGIILMAFILGIPANEIVLPIIVMGYVSGGALVEVGGISQLHALFTANGWTWVTALCTALFCLFHFPCSTTLLTIKKETGSLKWTLAAFGLPVLIGMLLCALAAALGRLL
ncbi:MAG: ferrous iron transport protein B [Oscillospiraceae bacterium]|jgi:ferrous iron transport protein B